jgi:hypothetical protein
MKHQIPDEIISTAELIPLIDKGAAKGPGARLELWAAALERHGGPLNALSRLEHLPPDELRAYRRNNTPLTVAFNDEALRRAGLSGDSLGDIMDFFDLSDGAAHRLLCDCHYNGTMTGAGLAKSIRRRAWLAGRRAALVQGFRRLFGRAA